MKRGNGQFFTHKYRTQACNKKPKHRNMKPDADDLSAVIGEASEKTKTSNGVTAAGKKDQVNIRINNRSTGG